MSKKNRISHRKIITYLSFIIAIIALVVSVKGTFYSEDSTGKIQTKYGKPVIVISGSMEPAIMTNSISIMKLVDINQFDIGDVVVFTLPEQGIMITHRVIEIEKDDLGNNKALWTKGDNNPSRDNIPITPDMVSGKIVKTFNGVVPYMNKIMLRPGEIKTTAVIQSILILLVTIAILGIGVYNIIIIIQAVVIANKGDKYYLEELNQYKYDLELHLKNLDILEQLESGDGKKDTTRNKLAKARAVREIGAFRETTKDFERVIRIVKLLTTIEIKGEERDEQMEIDGQLEIEITLEKTNDDKPS